MKSMKVIQRNLFMLFSVGTFLCIFVLVSLIAGNVYAAKINQSTNDRAKSGLVGMWSFDAQDMAGTNAYDKSTSFATGTITGTVTRVTGKLGQAISVDGSSRYVTINHQNSINFANTDDFTIGFWTKFNPQTVSSAIILEKWDGTAGGYSYTVRANSDGTIFFARYDGGNAPQVSSLTSISDNKWHNVVVEHIRSSKTMLIYIDGVRDNSSTYTTLNTITSTSNLCIGRRCDGNAQTLFNGSIDDLRIYNRALSAAEVKQLYNLGASKVNASTNARAKTNLVGMWSFNAQDMAGTDAYDKSTSFATGTLSGTTLPTRVVGKTGQALNFDGSTSYVTIADQSALKPSATMTLSAWVRPRTVSTVSGNINSIVEKGNVNTAGYGIFSANGNQFCGFVKLSGGLYGGASTNTFNLGKWHNVTIVVDTNVSSILKLYVNGVQETLVDITSTCDLSTSASGSISDDTSALTFGARTGTGSFYDGRVDDVRLYNYALSAAEVKRLYNLGK